jgi:hypothetical protein
VSTPDNDADEAPGVPAGRRRLGHATALDAGLLPFKLRPPIHHTSCLHRGRPRPRHHSVTTTSSCCRSPPRLGLVMGVIGLGADCAATWPMEKNAACSARAPLKDGAAVRGSGLKIATDVAGVLGSSEARAKTGAVRSHWREWRLTALSVRPGPAESVVGPMEKTPHRGDIQVRPSYRGAPGWILRCQESAERFQAPLAVAVNLSSSSRVKDASSGRHAMPVGRDLDVTSLQPGG